MRAPRGNNWKREYLWLRAAGTGARAPGPRGPDAKAAGGEARTRGTGLRGAWPRASPSLEVAPAGAARRRRLWVLQEGGERLVSSARLGMLWGRMHKEARAQAARVALPSPSPSGPFLESGEAAFYGWVETMRLGLCFPAGGCGWVGGPLCAAVSPAGDLGVAAGGRRPSVCLWDRGALGISEPRAHSFLSPHIPCSNRADIFMETRHRKDLNSLLSPQSMSVKGCGFFLSIARGDLEVQFLFLYFISG